MLLLCAIMSSSDSRARVAQGRGKVQAATTVARMRLRFTRLQYASRMPGNATDSVGVNLEFARLLFPCDTALGQAVSGGKMPHNAAVSSFPAAQSAWARPNDAGRD